MLGTILLITLAVVIVAAILDAACVIDVKKKGLLVWLTVGLLVALFYLHGRL